MTSPPRRKVAAASGAGAAKAKGRQAKAPVERILTLHPSGKEGVNIERRKYDAMRKAILAVVPRSAEGVPFGDLGGLAAPRLPAWFDASIMWYLTTVKLDLEARGELERIPGKGPQRVRRTR